MYKINILKLTSVLTLIIIQLELKFLLYELDIQNKQIHTIHVYSSNKIILNTLQKFLREDV